jgi:hypothetical protein
MARCRACPQTGRQRRKFLDIDDDGIWLVSVMDDDLADVACYPISGPDMIFLVEPGGAKRY